MAQTVAAAAAEDISARLKTLVPYFHTYRPSGLGPFPAILFVPGCLGFTPRAAPPAYTRLADAWKADGFAVVFVDFLRARGMTACHGDLAPADVAKDVLAVARYLQHQPFAKAARITAFGWSLGGGGVLAALDRMSPAERSPLHAVVAYTPVCDTLEPWHAKVPALVLMGADDRIAPPQSCRQLFARLPPGTPLEARLYPDAGHLFDLPGPGFNAAAAAAAARDVDRFINR
jgi:dienelactone hydrolase